MKLAALKDAVRLKNPTQDFSKPSDFIAHVPCHLDRATAHRHDWENQRTTKT